ncbi:hypothetical protein F5Y07DRAFT_408440 [Xylaria sp. FL0933]|nr:hypothetical protein F5Y07DRAFT_408440 [Xylaria sp. FL0933]
MTSPVYRCRLADDAILVRQTSSYYRLQNLRITFQRTVRVPDNEDRAKLPPDLGTFPLFKADDFARKLSSDEALKGGIFFPMYQREAMWVNFTADAPFMIKIYAGGVNVVSGEHNSETSGTLLRRFNRMNMGQRIQDYVVVPQQPWLDGFAVSPGVIRQFVAMPLGTRYSVEAQLTGQETVGGLQFEITPSMPKVRSHCTPSTDFSILVRSVSGKFRRIRCSPTDTIEKVKGSIEDSEGIPTGHQRLVTNGRQLEDHRTLESYNVQRDNIIDLLLRLRGGGWSGPMSVAAGGNIEQVIHRDDNPPKIWAATSTITIPVHILTTTLFRQVTGREPPPCPISMAKYAAVDGPFFDLQEKPSGISGAFAGIKSTNAIDSARRRTFSRSEPSVKPRVIKIDRDTIEDPDGIIGPNGPFQAFRSLKDLQDELKKEYTATRCSFVAPGERGCFGPKRKT